MAYRRRTRRRIVRPYRARRRYSRRLGFRRRSRLSSYRRYQVHHFKRSVQFDGIQGNAAYGPFAGAKTFTFNALPNATEFTHLYDQYKINFISYKFKLMNAPEAQLPAWNASNYPTLTYVIDRDDASTPGSLTELLQYGSSKQIVLRPNRWAAIKFKPSVNIPVYRTNLTSAYTPARPRFIDCNTTDVPHYGVKFVIDNLQNTSYVVQVEATYWFTCRETR